MRPVYLFFRTVHLTTGLISLLIANGQQKVSDFDPAVALGRHMANQGLEKAYVHTDKDFYATGETIWFKAYLVDGTTHRKSDRSRVVYIDLLNEGDSIVARKKLYVENLGANGEIALDKKLHQGTYTLRAYTHFMLNEKQPQFFEKKIPVWQQIPIPDSTEDNLAAQVSEDIALAENDKANIAFFPEGGHLVAGLEGVIGIKVRDKTGQGMAVKGSIEDDEGKIVAFFESHEFGLGAVKFKPENRKAYFATISGNDEKIPLPRPLGQGYVMRVENKGEHIEFLLTTNITDGFQGAYLLGHLRGKVVHKQLIETKRNENSYRVKFLTKGLTDGVAQFTLFAPNNEPVCERLVFIDRDDTKTDLLINSDSDNYGIRQRVSTTIELVDVLGVPLEGDLSMTVATADNIAYAKDLDNIESWLLLNSDMGATVPDPAYFFEDRTFARKYSLDLLMMTHGWRRFVWKDLLDGQVKKTLAHPPEKGIMIQGKVTEFNNRYRTSKAALKLNIVGLSEGVYQENGTTDLQGNFSFGPFIFEDSINGIINAAALENAKNKKPKDLAIITDTVMRVELPSRSFSRRAQNRAVPKVADYLEKAEKRRVVDFEYGEGITQLEEVTVTKKRKTRQTIIDEAIEDFDKTTLYRHPDARLFVDSLSGTQGTSLFDILRRVPGVIIEGLYPNQSAVIRGLASFRSNGPLYLLDGVPVDWEFVRFLRVNEFVFVDVLKGATGAIYGSRAANGVIAIYTPGTLRLPPEPQAVPNVDGFTIAGFSKVREFYSPDYGVASDANQKPDYRTTLYWEPFVPLEGQRSKSVSFYTGDNLGLYIIEVEGLTTDGRPVGGYHTLRVTDDASKH